MLDEVVTLTERDTERLLHVMRSSLEVRKRHQYFLWVQGNLQALLPHDVMVCAHGDFARRQLVFEHFSSVPLADADVAALVDPENGLVVQVARQWIERGERPLLMSAADPDSTLWRRFEGALRKLDLQNMALHGTPAWAGGASSCFALFRMPEPVTARTAHALDLLVPQLHVTLLRTLANERRDVVEPSGVERLITQREVEILQWVRDGKSNLEIGEILGISPLTVKNHVQKILKKLNVQNRAQAVARGISLQLIRTPVG
jgi:transcriptional regulator EpsA